MKMTSPAGVSSPQGGSGHRLDQAFRRTSNEIVAGWLGWSVALIGGVVLFGWITDVPLLRSLLPHQVDTKANTALAFVLSGMALGLLAHRRGRPFVPLLGATATGLIGLATLLQYLLDQNWGIDELLFKDAANAVDTVHPGRMAPPTALNFVLLGSALLLLPTRCARAGAALALTACGIAVLAFVGTLYDVPALVRFGPYTAMATPTGGAFLLLGLGVLLASDVRLVARARRVALSLGFVLSLLLLLLLAGAVVHNARLLVEANRRVTQAHEVLDRLAVTLSAMQDLETGTRGYLLTGNPVFLEPAEPAPTVAGRSLRALRLLVADSHEQTARLDRLEPLIERKMDASHRQVALYGRGDEAGAQQLMAAGEGKRLMDAIRTEVATLQSEERRLLHERQVHAEAGTTRTLLALGSGLAASLAVLTAVFLLLRQEIAVRTRLAAELRRSEESLAVTLNSIGDGVLATDTAGRITLLNRVAEQLTGWSRGEAWGRPVAEVFRILNEQTRAPAPVPVDAVLATGEIQGLANHTALVARDGTERAIADSAAPIRDAEGRVLGVVLVFRDVTAERAARKALHESEERYRTLFNSIDEGFCIIEMIFDAEGKPADYRFVEINQSFERQTGLRDALGKRMLELAPQHEAHWFETYGRIALTGEAIRFQNRAEQLHRTYDVYAFRLGNPQDRRVGILFNDITQRKQAEEELERFFSLSLDFLCIASADGWFKRASPAVTDILGWSVEEFLARPYMEQIHPDDRASAQREVERQAAGQKVMNYECRFRHKDGSWRILSWRSVPYEGLMYATARDVTEARRAEEQIHSLNHVLRQHAAQLEIANKELESFSYSVSHDLRAPLRHVQGYVEMLSRETTGALSEKAQRYLKTIADAAREMGELIDDLLTFSRMGRTEMTETEVDLGALVEEVRRSLAPDLAGRDVRWTVVPLPRVRADAAMLRQVLINLLGNAVKYTRRRAAAEIAIGCDGEEEGRRVFYVRDNGAGFDMKYADKLFGVFQRLHRPDEFEGTGIGLASVRRIISRHGGRTWAEARVNEGATFYFTLQAATSLS